MKMRLLIIAGIVILIIVIVGTFTIRLPKSL